jgi:hypothetical protein
MFNISESLSKACDRYFNSLAAVGYVKDSEVNKLLVVSIIEELLTGELSYFITEEDYRSLTNVLYCILGDSCLLSLPNYDTWDDIMRTISTKSSYRISEDSIIRVANDCFRIEA